MHVSRGFWDWMYPLMAGNENVEMAALGVLILWFSWYVCSESYVYKIYISYLGFHLTVDLLRVLKVGMCGEA